MTANNFGLGSGLSASVNSSAYGATSWTAGGADPFANATTNNDYFYFRVQASASNRVTLTGISRLTIQVSASGPRYWHLLYSETNSDAAFLTPARNFGPFEVVIPASSSLITDITAAVSTALSNNPIVINPSAIGYFRLTGFGGANSAGSGRVGSANTGAANPDFAVLGFSEVAYIPKDLTWNGASGAVWSTNSTDNFWLDASNSVSSFNVGDTVIFNGNANVAVNAAGVTVPIMSNNVGTGETQTFTGSPINVQTLLTKTGAGTLVFTPASGVDHGISEINLTGGTIRISQSADDTNNLDVLGGPRLTMAAGTVFDVGNSSYDILRNLGGAGTILMTNLIANTNLLSTNPLVPNNDIHLRNSSNTVFSGTFEGLGQLTIDSGTITLAGTNTHTGGTWLSNNATLRLSSPASLPVQTQKSLTTLDSNGNPYYTNGVFEVVDLRVSREASGNIMGTLELDDTRATRLVLSNSIGGTRTAGIFRVTGGSSNSYTLELNGPINLMGHLSGYNAADGGGYVILRGTNQIQGLNGVMLERGGRILVNGAHCLNAVADIGMWAPLSFSDASGYARFGLAPEVTNEVTLFNSVFANTNSTGTNRHAAFILSTNSLNGAPQVLRLAGVVTGVGGLRLVSPGSGDVGHLYLSAGNSYEGGTRIGTGKIFVPSADALGYEYSLRPASIGLIRFETRSDSHLVAMNDIDFPASHSIAVDDDGMANLDTGSHHVTIRGFITNFVAASVTGGHLRKLGSGTLTLLGINGYTGITRVSQGILEVGNAASLPANSRVQFGASGTLRFAAAGSYTLASVSPVVITNSAGTTNTETMAGVIDLAASGVNLTVTSVPLWTAGSSLTVANLSNGTVKLPASITNTPSLLAMFKSAESPTHVASVAGDGTLSFAPAVVKSNQTITFGPLLNKQVGDAPFLLTATASSGLTVSYSSANPAVATIAGSTVTIVGVGSTVITASQAGDSAYNAAANVTQTLTVTAAAGISDWLQGGATNAANVGKYAIGGATNINAASESPTSSVDATKLSLTAIVRTNDGKLTVVGEAGSGLTSWSTNGVSSVSAGSQSGVATGCERRVFSVDRTSSPTRQFLRLKAVYTP
ncbi:MAG: autotransporter-associated beta strand repeat-containing protein [Candidatus Methylacidiphilales bacterium]